MPANAPIGFQERKSRKQTAADILSYLVDTGKLKPGTVLVEGPIADRLGMSRMPVREALKLLEEKKAVHRFDGRGYLVGSGRKNLAPIRVDLRNIEWPDSAVQADSVRLPASDQIMAEVQDAITAVIPFGCYRISETELGMSYHVSRTVVRETLHRLFHLGIVEKDRWSHWIAGPLTAQKCVEQYHIRAILEAEALQLCAPTLSRATLRKIDIKLEKAQENIGSLTAGQIADIEDDLHIRCLSPIENRSLDNLIQRCQLLLVVHRVFADHVSTVQHAQMLLEHRTIIKHLIDNRPDDACAALKAHLHKATQRTIERLKVLSVVRLPDHPGYLKPFH